VPPFTEDNPQQIIREASAYTHSASLMGGSCSWVSYGATDWCSMD